MNRPRDFLLLLGAALLFAQACARTASPEPIKRYVVVFKETLPDSWLSTSGSKGRLDVVPKAGPDGGAALCWQWRKEAPVWSGMGFPLDRWKNVNAKPWLDQAALRFSIRAKKGKEAPVVKIEDEAQHSVGIKVLKYVPGGRFTGAWQDVVIPLADFRIVENGLDPRRLRQLIWEANPEPSSGEIWLDDVRITDLTRAERAGRPQPRAVTEKPLAESDAGTDGVFLGWFTEGINSGKEKLDAVSARVGRKPAMVMWYQDWGSGFPRSQCETMRQQGMVPHITWEPWLWSDHNAISLKDIADGKRDAYIRDFARAAKEWGHPFFLRVAHEMNGDWYPWCVAPNGKDPQIYVKAWRRMHDLFRKEKCANAIWVWCPNNLSQPNEPWNDPLLTYPGDAYVDWIGIDGYNGGSDFGSGAWISFENLFGRIYDRVVRAHPAKPVMIAEFAAGEAPGDKAAWLKEMMRVLPERFPRIKAVVWFDINKEAPWAVDSSDTAYAAARAVFRDKLFRSSAAGLIEVLSRFGEMIKGERFRAELAEQSRPCVAIARAKAPVTIDGELTEWNAAGEAVVLDREARLGWGHGRWRGTTDLSGKVSLLWDADCLYVAGFITDDTGPLNTTPGANLWQGDALEIFLGLDPAADPRRNARGPGDHQVGLSPGTGDGKNAEAFIFTKAAAGAVKVKAKKAAGGYAIEAAIPWSDFGAWRPKPGDVIGFDLALDDSDDAGVRESQMILFGSNEFYQYPAEWGRARLTE